MVKKMKFIALIAVALLAGCSTPASKTPTPPLNQPLSAEEKKILATCESEVEKIMAGRIDINSYYIYFEIASLMDKCLESQGIADDRISAIFDSMEGTSNSQ